MEPIDVAGHPRQLAAVAEAMHAAGSPPARIAAALASRNDALTGQLLRRAEEALGQPPCPYAWLALGSAGRKEQALLSDQDNAIVYLEDGARARSYFLVMAEHVVAGLAKAGFAECPGGYMATNWCRSLPDWKATFHAWVAEPTPQALVEAEVFLDFRRVGGELPTAMLDQIMLAGGRQGLFLFHLAQVARRFQPPLGAFGRIRPTRGVADLKRGGLAPIVLLARLYALVAQSTTRSTIDRLAAAGDAGELSHWGAAALIDAYQFLTLLRLGEQLRQVRDGQPPGNTVRIASLSMIDRRRLRDAFRTVRRLQDATALRFGPAI
jgi:CBS domain-containing protein